MSHECPEKLLHIVNQELQNIQEWFTANKLTLHPQKTYFMLHFPKKNSREIFQGKVKINENYLSRIGEHEEIKSIKFVGLHIDEKMSWKYHLNLVKQRTANGLRALVQCKNLLPIQVKLMIYNGIIKPHLEYGITLWGQAAKYCLAPILTLQKKAIRAIAGEKFNAHTTPLFANLGLLKIEHLYQINACKFVESVIRNEVPAQLSQLYKFDRPERSTRNNIKPHISTTNKTGPIAELANVWNKEERKMNGASVPSYIKALIRDYLWQYCQYKCDKISCLSC